jgi:hypothetical protein
VLTAPAPVVAGTPSLTSPTLVATPAVVSVQQPPPAVDSMTVMKVTSPEQPPMVQQVPNTNTNNAPVNRKLQQSSRGKFAIVVWQGLSSEVMPFQENYKILCYIYTWRISKQYVLLVNILVHCFF